MASGPRARVDPDGVRVVATRGPGGDGRLVGAAIVLAVLAIVGLGWMTVRGDGPEQERTRQAAADRDGAAADEAAPDPGAASRGVVPAPRAAAPGGADEPRPAARRSRKREAAAGGPERELTLGDVKPLLQGSREGIGVFPLPGTDPPKSGLIVPDDFPLPEGYVRHYQSTDDGHELPPILMFHPDYEWVDGAGRPLEIPADRVVPSALAPPGLPLRMLDVPAPRGAQDRDP